jgi:predicted ATPase/DNA-binding SARP family transcriptional activator
MNTPWRVELLGGLRAQHGDRLVTHFRTQNTGILLAYLAYYPQRAHLRDELIDLLWPDADPDAARTSLRQALFLLRQQLEPPGVPAGAVLLADRASVRLNPEAIATDVAEFDAAVQGAERAGSPAERAERLARAVELYQGELLHGYYEAWVLQEREWLAERFFQALGQLILHREEAGDLSRALQAAQRGVSLDPLREEAHGHLIRLYAAAGQPAAALRQYGELERRLQEELGTTPSAATGVLAREIERSLALRAKPFAVSPDLALQLAALEAHAPLPCSAIPAVELPTGTVTFLFTDVEGSTRHWEEHPEAMGEALARHDTLLRQAIESEGGVVFKTFGDQFCAAFASAPEALGAALAAQRRLGTQAWGEVGDLRVRMALHTGVADEREGDFYGPTLNRLARLLAAGHGGQILLSGAVQELVREHLPEGTSLQDLGEHRLPDLVRSEQIYQCHSPDLPADVPPLETLERRRNNLPAQLTPLLGREREVAGVRELLQGSSRAGADETPPRERAGALVRLVTLTGPGGVGKTRLALQVAAELLEAFADGVFFVSLAPIRDPNLVISSVAQTLAVKETGGRPLLESLKESLREKELLLLLDNFEQILDAAPLVAELLAASPRLKVLVTSRAALRLRGEHEFPVPPLAVPDPRHLPPLEGLSQYAAVELFIQRAANVKPDFAVTDETAPAMAEICYRLDGLPLALELAAARVRLFSPRALLSRLESRLKLLVGGARDLPTRQQTLRNTIGWSFDLLDETEKTLFRRLSVFVGGFTLEAVEAVCNAEGDWDVDVVDGVASLVDKNLLRQGEGTDGEPRFTMLETIREYARDCLAQSGEAEAIWQHHARFFLSLAEQAEPQLHGRDQVAWVERLETEHDNLRTAVEWALAREEASVGLRLAASLGFFWAMRGYITEGRARLVGLLALAGEGGTAARARALIGAGRLATIQSDLGAARSLLAESLALGQVLGDKWIIAVSLLDLGNVDSQQGDYTAARSRWEGGLALGRELDDRWLIAVSLYGLGRVLSNQGDYGTTRSLCEESLTLGRELGDRMIIGWSLFSLAAIAIQQNDPDAGRSLAAEGLALARELGDKHTIAHFLLHLEQVALYQNDHGAVCAHGAESLALGRELGDQEVIAASFLHLGQVAHRQGNDEAAHSQYEQALLLYREVKSQPGIAKSLLRLASLATMRGRARRAAGLFGAAEALREALGAPLPPAEQGDYERDLAAVHAALGVEAFTSAWAEGRALTLEQAVRVALGECEIPTTRGKDS